MILLRYGCHILALAGFVCLGCSGPATKAPVLPTVGPSETTASFTSDQNAAQTKFLDMSNLRSEQVYSALSVGDKNSDPAVNLEQRIYNVGQLDFQQLLEAVKKVISNDELRIDGTIQISGAKTRLLAAEQKILAMGFKYGKIVDFWRAQGIDPMAINSIDVYNVVGKAASYFNGQNRQIDPLVQQAEAQAQIDQLNADNAVGTVDKSVNYKCGTAGQPKCTPDLIKMESVGPRVGSFEECIKPSGLDLKHKCSIAAAIGAGVLFGKPASSRIGAIIAAAALICAAESTAPTAQFCSPANTFGAINTP